jgi:hypothetical protein
VQKLKSVFLATFAYAVLVAVLAVTISGPGFSQSGKQPGPDVRVVNKPTEPVPVTLQGSAQIDTSSPIPIRDVDAAVKQPFQLTIHRTIPDGGNTANGPALTVPAGKRLVIEYISAHVGLQAGQQPAMEILTTVNGEPGAYFFDLTTHNDTTFVLSQPARFYCDAGESVVLVFGRTGATGQGPGIFTISGYLENM